MKSIIIENWKKEKKEFRKFLIGLGFLEYGCGYFEIDFDFGVYYAETISVMMEDDCISIISREGVSFIRKKFSMELEMDQVISCFLQLPILHRRRCKSLCVKLAKLLT